MEEFGIYEFLMGFCIGGILFGGLVFLGMWKIQKELENYAQRWYDSYMDILPDYLQIEDEANDKMFVSDSMTQSEIYREGFVDGMTILRNRIKEIIWRDDENGQ